MTLVSLATAAVSFAVVDVSTSISKSCDRAGAACAHEAVPVVAVTFAGLGILALAVGVVPAILWIIASVRHNRQLAEQIDRGLDPADPEEHRRAIRGDEPQPGQKPGAPGDPEDAVDPDEAPGADGEQGLGEGPR